MTKKLKLFKVVEDIECTSELIWARNLDEAIAIFKENLRESIYFQQPKYAAYTLMAPKKGIAEMFLEKEKMS
jgi:hypothetical protein